MSGYEYVIAGDMTPPAPPAPPIDDPIYFDSVFKDYAVTNGEILQLSSGYTAEDTVIKSGGWMVVYGDASATRTRVENGGGLAVFSGVAGGLSCFFGGAVLCDGGELTGDIKLGGTMTVYSATGASEASLELALEERTGADEALIGDVGNISFGAYGISVNASQKSGTYALLGGWAGETFSASLYSTSGRLLGELESGVGVEIKGRTYSLGLADGSVTLTVEGAAPLIAGDLDNNGWSDIIMSHDAGFVGAWLIQPTQTASWGNLSDLSGAFRIIDTGDVDGDGNSDIILYNAESGVTGAWLLSEGGAVSGWQTVVQLDEATSVIGGGDFNGDGRYDLLLRNDNGSVGAYLTDGTGWQFFGSVGTEWTISVTGDLNGDGLSDLILRHDAGFTGTWLVQEGGAVLWSNLDTLSDEYEILGAADFNGDGIDDVLLSNTSNRNVGAWLMDSGGGIAGWMGLGTLNEGVTVEALGDFNSDGVADLRVRTSDGNIGCLLVLGEDDLEWHYYGSVGAEWTTKLA